MNKDQERAIRAAALVRWRTERGDYSKILDEESHKVIGRPFNVQRLARSASKSGAPSSALHRSDMGTMPLSSGTRVEIMRRAHQSLSAMGKLPIMTGKKYNAMLTAAVVPGQPGLTYERYVASLLTYGERYPNTRKLASRVEVQSPQSKQDAPPQPKKKKKKKLGRSRGPKTRSTGSGARSSSVLTIRR